MTPEVREMFSGRKQESRSRPRFPHLSAGYTHLGAGAMQEAVKRLPSLTTGEHTG